MRTLVLASTSAYRSALLRRLGIPFSSANPAIDEIPLAGETPEQLVLRLSEAKSRAVAHAFPDAIIIGSDQVGVLADRILNKPGTPEAAQAQLRSASGQTVRFLTGLCVLDAASGAADTGIVSCRVHFRELGEAEIDDYIARERPLDCAGSFKVEGLGIALFRGVEMEDPTALEGLPLIRLTSVLQRFRLPVLGQGPAD